MTAGIFLFSSSGAKTDYNSFRALAFNTSTYQASFGLRVGETSGIAFKKYFGHSKAIEGMVAPWHRGLSTTLLIEQYKPAFEIRGLHWYYGGGAHAAFDLNYTLRNHWGDRYIYYQYDGIGLGIDAILGIEYKIPPLPLAISLDIKPFFEVNTAGGTWMAIDPGIGLKITF